ncbi:MAG: hypothetical protein WC641_08345 [Patescibacteria group bacterium]
MPHIYLRLLTNCLMSFGVFFAWLFGQTQFGKDYGALLSILYMVAVGVGKHWYDHGSIRLGLGVDFNIFPPFHGRPGKRGLSILLAQIYGNLAPEPEDRLRLTLFVPDSNRKCLVQIARYCWNHDDTTSGTEIRMGTCAVGHAYNRGEFWFLPDVDTLGGFEKGVHAPVGSIHNDLGP